jgi:hypothetical protein
MDPDNGFAGPLRVDVHEAVHFLDGRDRLFPLVIFLIRSRPRRGSHHQDQTQYDSQATRHGKPQQPLIAGVNDPGVNASGAMPALPA